MLMQNLGGQTKSVMVFSGMAYSSSNISGETKKKGKLLHRWVKADVNTDCTGHRLTQAKSVNQSYRAYYQQCNLTVLCSSNRHTLAFNAAALTCERFHCHHILGVLAQVGDHRCGRGLVDGCFIPTS